VFPRPHRILVAGLAGALAGAFAAIAVGPQTLALYGFWAGVIWPLLALAPLAFWFSATRQRAAVEAIVFALGTSLGLGPTAWLEARGQPAYEFWFPLAIASLTALVLAPLYVALRVRFVRQDSESGSGAA